MSLQEASILLENGGEIVGWTSYSINSDFLTPTDGWSFTVGGKKSWDKIKDVVKPDYKIKILIDGKPQLSGWIDVVTLTSDEGGLTVNIQGRDILRPLIKSNIYPGFKIKDKTVEQMIETIVWSYYTEPPDIYFDPDSERQVLGITSSYKKKDRSALKKKLIEYCQAHPGEGVFEFLSRNIRRHGLWVWAAADGSIVVGGPEYDQEPSYIIERKEGTKRVSARSAAYTHDRTDVVAAMHIRGKSIKKEWNKTTVVGAASDQEARSTSESGFAEVAFTQHDQAESAEQCDNFALQEMSRLKQNERVYTCTMVGHKDLKTGNTYQVNTVATVDDEFLGVQEDMFVVSRTFRRDSGGTTTDLKLVPLGSIVLSDVDWPSGDTGLKKANADKIAKTKPI